MQPKPPRLRRPNTDRSTQHRRRVRTSRGVDPWAGVRVRTGITRCVQGKEMVLDGLMFQWPQPMDNHELNYPSVLDGGQTGCVTALVGPDPLGGQGVRVSSLPLHPSSIGPFWFPFLLPSVPVLLSHYFLLRLHPTRHRPY